jgi:DNA-binding GntR family transcriptional regulator
LTREDARDVLEVIEALCSLSARLAAERISAAADKKLLRQIMANLAVPADVFEFARMRDRFYHQLARIAGNRELERMIPAVQAHLVRVQFRAAYTVKLQDQRTKDYQEIVEAVLAQDGAKAERAMRRHIRSVARAVQELPDQTFG